MSRSPDEKNESSVPEPDALPVPAIEPVQGCVTCGRASTTMYNQIVSARDGKRATTLGPFCQTCWDKSIR
jgi:hypothetical protein